MSDGAIRNGYTVKLLNMIPEPRTIQLSVDGLPDAAITAVGVEQIEAEPLAIEVEPDRLRSVKVYVRLPRDRVAGTNTVFRFVAKDAAGAETASYAATFIAPEASR